MLALPWLAPPGARAQERPFRLAKAGARLARLPLRVRRNLLLVPILINGKGPYQFVLDTGVETAILTDSAARQELALPPGRPLLIEGAGEEAALRASLVPNVRVRMPGVAEAPITLAVLSNDVLKLSRYVGEPVAGIIGADVFRSFVVEVRARRGIVRLHDPARFRPPRRAAHIPLLVREGKPYVRALVGQSDHPADTLWATLILDTGAGHALSLETGTHPALRLPERRLRSQLGRGLNGPINGWLGRVAALQLGPYRIRRLLASFPDSAAVRAKVRVPRQGNLGYELLKRFQVWFDYADGVLWLLPGAQFREPFEHDMSGLDIVACGPGYNRFVIERVESGSPGDDAGLQPGDELLLIDGRVAAEYSLTSLSQLLHSADGRHLHLMVQRPGGGFFFTELTLRRVI